MPRYIDADALTRRFKRRGCFNKETFGVMAATIIATAPTADVAEVVRCEKCLHSEANDTGYWCKKACYIADAMVTPQHFCGYGERRNDEQKTDS